MLKVMSPVMVARTWLLFGPDRRRRPVRSPPVTTPGPFLFDGERLGAVVFHGDDQGLDVQDDVGDILHDAVELGELMVRRRRFSRTPAARPPANSSRIRRSELPTVVPKPRSKGSTMNLP